MILAVDTSLYNASTKVIYKIYEYCVFYSTKPCEQLLYMVRMGFDIFMGPMTVKSYQVLYKIISLMQLQNSHSIASVETCEPV